MAAEPTPDEVEAQKRLGRAISAGRARKRMTQEVFADRIGVHKNTVGYIENGKQRLRRSTARRVEDVLHWKTGTCDQILNDPDADPATYEQDPPTGASVSVDMARTLLDMAKNLQPQLRDNPEMARQVAQSLATAEAKLALVVEHEFTADALKTLMDLNAARRDLSLFE